MDYRFLRDEEERQKQQQVQTQIQRQRNKMVGLQNTGNLCYLNSTMQVVFSMPVLCDQIITFFQQKDPSTLNATSLTFLKKLKEKQAINTGNSEKDTMDLSELRLSFNKDLTKRHRRNGDCFGMKQNDSSEFYLFLLEFLVKFGKEEDPYKDGRGTNSDPVPNQIDRAISRRNYSFSSQKMAEFQEYFIKEQREDQTHLEKQMDTLTKKLSGKNSNPVEEAFFNGHVLSALGPCRTCKYQSVTIHDCAMFELNFPQKTSYFGLGSVAQLPDMLTSYFKSTSVNSRCKNPACKKHPLKIAAGQSERTIYQEMTKKQFLVNIPKVLKIMFKKYEWSPFGGGSRLSNNVSIPVCLSKEALGPLFFQPGSVPGMDKSTECTLQQITNNQLTQDYYLFSYSQQSGSLDSGHYITHTLQYYLDKKQEVGWFSTILNDSSVSIPQQGGEARDSIQTDAYWVMYVRGDQEDFQNQLKYNKAPEKIQKQSKGLFC